jgi:hypothetical protein
MKNLVLGSLIALTATQAAGCIITTNDPDDARVSATWTLRSISTGTTATCPPGFNTAALYNQEVTSAGTPIGSPIIDLFDCAAGAGTSAPLPPALFLTWIEITNDNNTQLYAQSTSAYVDVTFSDKTFSAQILTDGGYFQFAWNLRGATSNQNLTCNQAGLAADGSDKGIQLEAFVSTGTTAIASDKFDCADGGGITAGLPAASYEVLIDAFTMSGPIGSAPVINSVINAPNKVTNLGTVDIPINGL